MAAGGGISLAHTDSVNLKPDSKDWDAHAVLIQAEAMRRGEEAALK
jgi:hypothetical protein